MPGRSSESNKRMSSYLKQKGEERRTGRCAVCYRMIPNDTFGGAGAYRHYPAECCGGKNKTLKD